MWQSNQQMWRPPLHSDYSSYGGANVLQANTGAPNADGEVLVAGDPLAPEIAQRLLDLVKWRSS